MNFLLIDDHPLFQLGFKSLCEQLSSPPDDIRYALSCEQATQILLEKPPLDLIFIDLNLPDGNGVDLLKLCRQHLPDVPSVILSAAIQPAIIQQVLMLGAQGYIPKGQDAHIIIKAIDLVLSGGLYIPSMALSSANPAPNLTHRQIDILTYISQGNSNKQISSKIHLSEGSVRNCISVIFDILSVKNRSEAVSVAHSNGLINL